jgi:fatty-acyl-CoA synthase
LRFCVNASSPSAQSSVPKIVEIRSTAFCEVDGVVQPAPAPRFDRTPAPRTARVPTLKTAADEILAQWRTNRKQETSLEEAIDPRAGIPAWLATRAGDDTTCLLDGGKPIRWATLVRRTGGLAAGLAALGVREADRVALWLPNRTAWLASFFACAQLGAIAVSVNTRFRSAEVGDLLQRSGARVLVCWPGFKAIDFAGILAQCGPDALKELETVVVYSEEEGPVPDRVAGKRAVSYASLLEHEPLTSSPASGESPCIIFTTSGTTKAPKMVLHKQANVLGHGLNVARQYGLGPGKRFLLLPPFCGVYGFCSAMAALTSRSLLVMEAAWTPAQYAGLIEAQQITHFSASNEAVAQLLDARPGSAKVFPSLELVVQANLNPAHADIATRADARGVKAVGLYGSSEMQALFSLSNADAPAELRGRHGGVPASAMARVRTRDTDTQQLCAIGQAGELEFLAPESCFVEYYRNPEATAQAFTSDGWFRSGDLGQMEADGSFTYLARMGDTLRLGGFLVSPAEIEAVVQEDPAVESCQVVGARTQDAVKPVAFVLARSGQVVNEAAVIRHVAARLAKYKVPVRVVTLQEFPITPSANGSKVQKTKLRDTAETLLAQQQTA